MYWALLILCDVPVYLLIGWVVFDTKDKAADTFFDTTVALLRIILIPQIVRVLLGIDDSDAYGLFQIGLYFAGCAAVTYGEHVALQKLVFGN